MKNTGALLLSSLLLASCATAPAGDQAKAPSDAPSLLARLEAGNRRAASNHSTHPHASSIRRNEIAQSQAPFAIVVSCSDSRVPPELLFDQGYGDLFVIRLAGNIVDDAALGSIEYAVEHLHSNLVVVLGHERCGAVKAAIEGGEAPGHIGTIIDAIKPAVDESANASGDRVDAAVRANVRRVAEQIRSSSPILAADEGLVVAGMIYDLDSGLVQRVP